MPATAHHLRSSRANGPQSGSVGPLLVRDLKRALPGNDDLCLSCIDVERDEQRARLIVICSTTAGSVIQLRFWLDLLPIVQMQFWLDLRLYVWPTIQPPFWLDRRLDLKPTI